MHHVRRCVAVHQASRQKAAGAEVARASRPLGHGHPFAALRICDFFDCLRKQGLKTKDLSALKRPTNQKKSQTLRAGSARALLRLVLALARPLFPGVEGNFPAAGAGHSRHSGRDAGGTNFLPPSADG
jgi:hypothetical protein